MIPQTLGTTTLPITRLGLGLAALGRPGYINLGHATDLKQTYDPAAMEVHAHAVLDAAYQAGIRYIDAARSYGRAEEFLGRWLRSRNIDSEVVTVGSKWGYTYTANWQVKAETHEVKEHSLAKLRQQWPESRANLAPYLRLYQIHSATLESGVLEDQPVLAELARLKAEAGLAIGLSVSRPQQGQVIDRAVAVEVEGVRLFDSVQATWNLFEQSAGAALARAADAGLGVIVKEAVANGRLTSQNHRPADADRMTVLSEVAHQLKATVDQVALAAVLAQPWVAIVLSGAARLEHLQSNEQALALTFDEATRSRLMGLAEPAETYWQTRSNLPWN